MTKRQWGRRSITGMITIVLLASLILNYNSYKRGQRENQYVQLMYNQFIFDVAKAAQSLGSINHDTDYPRAAANTIAAASELKALHEYEVDVNNQSSVIGYPPYSNQVANFLSYVSSSLMNENEVFVTQNGSYTLNRQAGQKYMLDINNILTKNMRNSTIPDDKVDTVFNQLYNLIPNDFRTNDAVTDDWQL